MAHSNTGFGLSFERNENEGEVENANTSPSRQHARPPQRQTTWTSGANYQTIPLAEHDVVESPHDTHIEQTYGLGLRHVSNKQYSSVVRRKPVDTYRTPDLSYQQGETLSQVSTAHNSGPTNDGHTGGQWTTPRSSPYLSDDQDNPYEHTGDDVHLVGRGQNDAQKSGACPTHGDLLKEKVSWLSIIFILLAVFSWLGSGAFLGIAIARPRWGHRVGTSRSLSYGTATLLSALFAKMVELTFACSYVATLGQILSRRAFPRDGAKHSSHGISLAEMNLRLWIMQPGTLITHWEGAKYVITTVLGITTLAAAFSAAFYTTAVEALVSPKLKFGQNETRILRGPVSAPFADPDWLSSTCESAIPSRLDPIHGGNTCLQIAFAGSGFRNFQSWQTSWYQRETLSRATPLLEADPRPAPFAMLNDNTTVRGKWLTQLSDTITSDSAKYQRLVMNISMVMPHANVFHAAQEPSNGILQPSDLQGAGQFWFKAAVPSPAINVLCVGASEAELSPLVGNETHIPDAWPNIQTPLDSLFQWSQQADTEPNKYFHPWFSKLPIEFNTVGNTTTTRPPMPWIYLLAKPPSTVKTNEYTLCGIRAFQFSDCSTRLFASLSGARMEVHCGDDPRKWKSYANTTKPGQAPIPVTIPAPTWTTFGAEWIRSLALTHGVSDGNASSARLLTQMIPAYDITQPTKLDPGLPSIAEALSVLAGQTLLLASNDAPFVHHWNYSRSPLIDPVLEEFEALVAYRDYASGGDQNWEGMFYVILLLVFALNTYCAGALILYYCKFGEVTDYTEPQNLFALAINSPPTKALAGSCGCGPTPEMLGRKWRVNMRATDQDDWNPDEVTNGPRSLDPSQKGGAHFYVHYPEDNPPQEVSPPMQPHDTPKSTSGFVTAFRHSANWSPMHIKHRTRTSATESAEFEMVNSPAISQYMKLTGR